MATASLIASAIAILLLVVTAYALMGGTLSTASMIAGAQSDAVHHQEIRLRTSIAILDARLNASTATLWLEVENTGSETVGDFDHMDIYLSSGGDPMFHPRGSGPGTWSIVSISPDSIHPGMLDPGEVANLSVAYVGDPPQWVQVVTASGVYDSRYIV
ncbi:MAG: hypothetical protein QMD46_07955 [Methanomicrobiales archaeon]|nr:hypothetical protein [Methanomicrobiales archaeon]MDI6877333.1 hypothetical protein [Methanomicrobiales archaeon]